MSVRNVGGHGVSSMAGHHNQQAMAAQPTFQGGGGMTDSQRHASDSVTAYKGGAKGSDVGAYGRPSGSKKSFPPAK
jgi:hypothetical protein